MIEINSPQNTRVKRAVKLRTSRGRQQQRRILIEGVRELRCAMDAGISIEEVFYDAKAMRHNDVSQVWEDLAPKVDRLQVTPNVWKKLAMRGADARLLAVAQAPTLSLDKLDLPDQALVLVLESIEKPGNVGAIYRSADGVGVDAILLANPVCDVYSPNSIRSSLGTVFSIPTAAGSNDEVAAALSSRGIRCLTARVDAATEFWDADMKGATAIIMGSEAHGLSNHWKNCDALKLPMQGKADSLNVSVAASVLLYEARRQRR